MKLSERAILVTLHTGAWTGSLVDKQVTEEVSEANNAAKNGAGRYNKQIVASRFLSAVNSKVSQIRRTHFALSLPWEDSGARILATRGYENYCEQIRNGRIMVEAAAREFVKGMDVYIDEAKVRLGDMFDAADYPEADEILSRFYVEYETQQVPEAGDFRAALTKDQVKAVVKDIEARTNERVQIAMHSAFERIADVTGKMAEKLRDFEPATGKAKGQRGKAAFRATLVYNVKELAELLPSLNITGDKRLDQLQKDLLKLCDPDMPPEVLRIDAKARAKMAKQADDVFKKVSEYLA